MIGMFISEVSRGFGWNLVRNIFGTLDKAVFGLFGIVMGLLYDIALELTNGGFSGIYGSIQSRIYVILTIYMLFKVTFSILGYIVNPDSLTDKSQGVGKLVTRIIITLIMLIAFPTVERELLKLQKDIMNDHTVERIILGNEAANSDEYLKRGSIIAANVYNGAFFSSGGDAVICGDDDKDGEVDCQSKDYSLSTTTRVILTTTGAVVPNTGATSTDSEKVLRNDAGVPIPTVGDLVDHINDPVYGIPDEYKFDYTPFVGTLVGGIMVAIVLSMCIDIAIRTFKLIILFAIAPIPIMSYVDPKSSKDGAFSKWA